MKCKLRTIQNVLKRKRKVNQHELNKNVVKKSETQSRNEK